MKKTFLISFFLFGFSVFSISQNDYVKTKKLSLELMVNSVADDGHIREIPAIRQVLNNSYGNYYSLTTDSKSFYVEARLNYMVFPRILISSGLRVTQGFYFIDGLYSNSSSSTIQIKYRDDETGVYYANVNKISEYKTYLGIPVVLTFRLLDKKYIGLDLDISAEFSYKIYSVISFDFTDPSMKEIKNEAADAIKAVKINDYSWSSAVGLMLRVGKID